MVVQSYSNQFKKWQNLELFFFSTFKADMCEYKCNYCKVLNMLLKGLSDSFFCFLFLFLFIFSYNHVFYCKYFCNRQAVIEVFNSPKTDLHSRQAYWKPPTSCTDNTKTSNIPFTSSLNLDVIGKSISLHLLFYSGRTLAVYLEQHQYTTALWTVWSYKGQLRKVKKKEQ